MAYAYRSDSHKLSDIKNRAAFRNAWEKRAFISASYVLGDEGKHWRKSQKFNIFEDYVRISIADLDFKSIYGELI